MEEDPGKQYKKESINTVKMLGAIIGAIFLLCVWLGFSPQWMNPSKPSAKPVTPTSESNSYQGQTTHLDAPVIPPGNRFNTSDKSADSNGNLIIAAEAIQHERNIDIFARSEKVSASKLTKSPYSMLGRVVRITGKIFKVEEQPPNPDLSGSWSSILMLVGNQNSPLGVTTVNFIFNGDTTNINSGQVVTCSGYFLGSYESQNSVGGTLEGILILGNHITHKRS